MRDLNGLFRQAPAYMLARLGSTINEHDLKLILGSLLYESLYT